MFPSFFAHIIVVGTLNSYAPLLFFFFYWERKLKNYLTFLKNVISFYKDVSIYIYKGRYYADIYLYCSRTYRQFKDGKTVL